MDHRAGLESSKRFELRSLVPALNTSTSLLFMGYLSVVVDIMCCFCIICISAFDMYAMITCNGFL